MANRKTHSEFLKEIKVIHPDLIVLGEYKTISTKILVKDHLEIQYKIRPNDLLKGVKPSINSSVDKDMAFKIMSEQVHGKKYNYSISTYEKNNIKVEIFCNTCSKTFYIQPYHHLNGIGCKTCGLQKVKDKNQKIIEERAKTIEYDIIAKHNDRINCDRLIYKGSKVKSLFGCNVNKEHDYWEATPNDILSGCGCPECNSSKGEVRVSDTLKILNIEFVRQKTFKGCKFKKLLKFDFYLPEYNTCIEYDGRQHFQVVDLFGEEEFLKTQQRDAIKNIFCQDNGIELLRIPYTEKENIEQILKENF